MVCALLRCSFAGRNDANVLALEFDMNDEKKSAFGVIADDCIASREWIILRTRAEVVLDVYG
jgi:hypothetical protein